MQQSERQFEAWLIDLDGTLYRPKPVKRWMAVELLCSGWFAIPKIRAFRRQHELVRQDEAHSTDDVGPYQRQLDRTAQDLNMDVHQLQSVVERWMLDKPGKWLRLHRHRQILTEIADFRQQGGKTAVVSDYPATRKLEAMAIRQLFDTVVANGEPQGPQQLKPDPEGYLKAAERLGVAPKDCLVIGDRQDADGEAAQRAGMSFRLV